MLDELTLTEEETSPPQPKKELSRARGLAGLAGLFLLGLFAILGGYGWTVLAIVAILTLVLLHELGHFATAKWTGMKATEFFVGFGPRLWSFRRGETEYGIKALPLGGYVRIIGFTADEVVDPADEARSYMNQAFWKRILVSSAGSLVHFLLALFLAFLLIWASGTTTVNGAKLSQIATFNGTSPAVAAGIEPGDIVRKVNGQALTSIETLTKTLHGSVNKPVQLTIDRNGTTKHVTVTPVDGRQVLVGGKPYVPEGTTGFENGYGVIGIAGLEVTSAKVGISPVTAASRSGSFVWSLTSQTVTGLADRLSPKGLAQLANLDLHPSTSTSPTALQQRPTSIYGMVSVATQAASIGWQPFVELLIVINVAIGLLNMLPMLPLDGGHVAIAFYERIRTRRGQPHYRANLAKLMPVTYVFVAVLGFLVLSSLYLDISHPAPNPFTR
jgi:membrane-associated protease RseP (regulator of RpoE activity)